MTAALEFQSSDEMRRRYSDAKAKLWGPRPRPIRFIPPPPVIKIEPPPEPAPVLTPEPESFVLNTPEKAAVEVEGIVRPTLHALLVHVSVKHRLTINEIISASRNARVVHARQEYFYLAARETLHSYPSIAKACGDRDHTTALYGVLKYSEKHHLQPPRGAALGSLERKRYSERDRRAKAKS